MRLSPRSQISGASRRRLALARWLAHQRHRARSGPGSACENRRQPHRFSACLGSMRLDRVDRAFRHADPAIDAFVRVDDEHVLALVEAVHGAHVDAVHDFAANTALVDDEGQLSVLSADRSGELIHGVRPSSRCSFIG